MRKALCLVFILLFSTYLFSEELPKPHVVLFVNNIRYENNMSINLRSSEKVELKAVVYGGRRSWCMEPNKYANIGKNTTVNSYGEDHLIYSIPPSFSGEWRIIEEKASWFGQLTNDIKAEKDKNSAQLTAPEKKGEYKLTVKVSSKWHYKRIAQGVVKEQDEINEAEGSFTIIVSDENAWFSSANISVSGEKDDDLKFRLEALQNRYELISSQILDGKFSLVNVNIEGFKENLNNIKSRLEALKKEKAGFNCVISLFGSPADKGMTKMNALKKLFEEWKKAHSITTGNAQQINKILLDNQINFSNNILKSIVKNYIDWGSGLPQPTELFGAVPYNLKALTIPGNVLDWYGNAMEDASILKNQAINIKRLSELRNFYLKRADEIIIENKKIKEEIDKNKQIETIASNLNAILLSQSWGKFIPK